MEPRLFSAVADYFDAAPTLQGFGSLVFGGQVGTGSAFKLLEAVIVRAEAAAGVWVAATAPVSARTTTKARTMIFMRGPFYSKKMCSKILVDIFAEVTIRWVRV